MENIKEKLAIEYLESYGKKLKKNDQFFLLKDFKAGFDAGSKIEQEFIFSILKELRLGDGSLLIDHIKNERNNLGK